jgi:hypothetical protein
LSGRRSGNGLWRPSGDLADAQEAPQAAGGFGLRAAEAEGWDGEGTRLGRGSERRPGVDGDVGDRDGLPRRHGRLLWPDPDSGAADSLVDRRGLRPRRCYDWRRRRGGSRGLLAAPEDPNLLHNNPLLLGRGRLLPSSWLRRRRAAARCRRLRGR